VSRYLKAIYAAAMAALGATGTAYAEGGGHIGWQAGIVIATATLTAFGVVWGVPNSPSTVTLDGAAVSEIVQKPTSGKGAS
jgi:hypothetical protein